MNLENLHLIDILDKKKLEIEQLLSSKEIIPKQTSTNEEINYNTKTTLYKIQAEQDKKKRESKRNKKDYTEYCKD